MLNTRVEVLDHGYVKLVESWGSDERIVEAARMSTAKGFLGWGGQQQCRHCGMSAVDVAVNMECSVSSTGHYVTASGPPGDEKLLRYLYTHKHHTPFEMGGLIVEVQAPIFVFREWHRHRTQSYNELSARYTPMPNLNYVPTRERITEGASLSRNRQATGTVPFAAEAVSDWLQALRTAYAETELAYQTGLAIGIPKELARLPVPVGRYSRMRASANLRNWLLFLTLRMAPEAQWEIRQYANVVSEFVREAFPRTHELFLEDLNR
jgi:thymidylate synthase (FAD)